MNKQFFFSLLGLSVMIVALHSQNTTFSHLLGYIFNDYNYYSDFLNYPKQVFETKVAIIRARGQDFPYSFWVASLATLLEN